MARSVINFAGPQPGAGLLTKSVSAGDRSLMIVTNTPVHSDAIVLAPSQVSTLESGSQQVAIPLVSRQGPMYMDQSNPTYGNRPKIEIFPLTSLGSTAASGSATSSAINTFDQMILGSVQEQDSEKTDVHETFGVPHFFASGRFVRRFTFSGAVRAAPVNYQSNQNELKVTQFVLIRLFYDTFMRITIQAQNSWFTRITVNQEIYEGFVSTMNFNTAAENEHFVPFVFSMFGINRRNDVLDSAGTSVLGGATAITSTKSTARAEVNDALVRSTVQALPNSSNLGVLKFGTAVRSGVAKQAIRLNFSPRPQLMTVTSDTPGIQPVYAGNGLVPLNGSVPPTTSFPINFAVTDYWLLYSIIQSRVPQAALPFGTTNAGTPVPVATAGTLALISGTANFSITTADKQVTKVSAQFSLTPPANVTASRVLASISGNNVGTGSVVGTQAIMLGEIPSALAFDGSNVINLQLKYFLGTQDGSPVPADALVGATVVYDIQDVYPALGTSLIAVDNSTDAQICNALFGLNNTLTATGTSLYNQMTLGLNAGTLLNATNPLVEADRIVVEMRPTITFVNYPAVKLPALSVSIYLGAAATQQSLLALNFVGPVWMPVQAAIVGTNGMAQNRLDQFGFLMFSITTENGQDVPASVYTALQKGSLTFQTQFASQEPQSSARIDPVPLNGTSYGTGELVDPDAGSIVYLRTILNSITFDASKGALILSIGVNTTFNSGFAAYLYSARFWAYISNVISANISIPSGVAPPVSF